MALDVTNLIIQLNDLLISLHLPFTLESPTDLTPSLLLAILESILGVRIPIDQEHSSDSPPTKRTQQIQIIKIFLGVLETDVLKADIGLSRIDPRLLADGAWDEVISIAEVLCWIGRETGLVSSIRFEEKGKSREDNNPPLSLDSLDIGTPHASTSPSSSITFLPPFSSPFPQSDNTDTLTSLLFTEANNNDLPLQPSLRSPPQSHPGSSSHYPQQLPPARRTGYISLVDHDSELSTFLSHSLNITSTSPLRPTRGDREPTTPHSRHKPQQRDVQTLISESPEHDPRRTLQLLQDRTRLMEELLRLRMSKSSAR